MGSMVEQIALLVIDVIRPRSHIERVRVNKPDCDGIGALKRRVRSLGTLKDRYGTSGNLLCILEVTVGDKAD